ncbi:MAG: hypothetical protein ACK5KR_05310 [Breznakia sp.]
MNLVKNNFSNFVKKNRSTYRFSLDWNNERPIRFCLFTSGKQVILYSRISGRNYHNNTTSLYLHNASINNFIATASKQNTGYPMALLLTSFLLKSPWVVVANLYLALHSLYKGTWLNAIRNLKIKDTT